MSQKSTLPANPESGASLGEILLGIAALAGLFAIVVFFIVGLKHYNKVDRTFAAIYALKEEVKKVNRGSGTYEKGSLLPLLITAAAVPDGMIIEPGDRSVSIPMGQPLDINGLGTHFSVDIYSFTQEECLIFGEQFLRGRYFALGNPNDDFDFLKIAGQVFSDENPLTPEKLKEACHLRFSIDVNMAFR